MGGHTADVEDYTDGRLEEQRAMREAQINLFGRLCCFEPLKMNLLQGIAAMFQQLDKDKASPTEAEVPVQLMIAMAH